MKQFKIIGITVRTTNENDKAMRDIPALWTKFLSGNLIEKIPNKLGSPLFSIGNIIYAIQKKQFIRGAY